MSEVERFKYYVKNGPFSASKDMIIIELKHEFSDTFDYIYNCIQDNFKYDPDNKKSIITQLQNIEIEEQNIEEVEDAQEEKSEEEVYTDYTLDDICDVIDIGKNVDMTNETKNIKKKCTTPYYTENGLIYCNNDTYEGQYILCTRIKPNKGELLKVDGKFSANKNMIIIKLKEEYNNQFDNVYEYIKNNFDVEKTIKEYPVLVEINGKKSPTTNISKFHLKKFVVKLNI
jgi:hypothetical protein